MAYKNTEAVEIYVQPLDGFRGAPVGSPYTMLTTSAAVNESDQWVDFQEIRHDSRTMSDARKNASSASFKLAGFMRAATSTNAMGNLLRWSLGTPNAQANKHLSVTAQAATSGAGGTAFTAMANTVLQAGGGLYGLAVGDTIFIRPTTNPVTTAWTTHKVLTITAPVGAGSAAGLTFSPSWGSVGGVTTFDIQCNQWEIGNSTQWADVYVKYGPTDGEVARSCFVKTLGVAWAIGGVTWSCDGMGHSWERVTAFPANPVALSDTQVFVFSDYVASSSLPLLATYDGDLALTVDNSSVLFPAGNMVNPIGGILGNPNISVSGSMFVDTNNDIKVEALNELKNTVRIVLNKGDSTVGFEAYGNWSGITSEVSGSRSLLAASGSFKISHKSGSPKFKFFSRVG